MAETAGPWRPGTDPAPDPAACARTLAAAFTREPAVTWICGGSAAARTRWFETTLRTHATLAGARRHTLTDPSGRMVAAAVLTPPGAVPGAGARALWAARTAVRCGPRALGRTLRYLHAAETGVPDGAWTLEFVGVLPELTGRGAGRVLLDHLLDATPAPAGFFLTTADPANVTLYRRFGFEVVRRTALAGLEITAMARPAGG
ncbi:GNAT family N-acetyltransferase [Streptomyces sp. NPDC090022]|uniref:GNAT family N-acetyltransferase n=1 Tax=Streptomyces sp. NPDC090022 TaxID=3365920 RepID=UPI00381646D2